MTLNQHNRAVEFQKSMDRQHANLFARALPHDDTALDTESIRGFEDFALKHPDMTDALAFLHEAISPFRLALELGMSPLERKLSCGI